jgi:hypothetical protein
MMFQLLIGGMNTKLEQNTSGYVHTLQIKI